MSNFLDDILPSMPEDTRMWSDLQNNIFAFGRDRSENLLIQAVAGSGKTTTIIEILNHVQGSFIFLAFNADIAEAIRNKTGLSKQIVRTINSMGHGLWFKYMRNSQLEPRKSYLILSDIIGSGSQTYKDFASGISRLVSLAKSHGLGLNGCAAQTEDFIDLSDNYYIDFLPERQIELCELAHRVFKIAIGRTDIFDFDDQVYGPLFHKWQFPKLANLILDEAQDLNEIQHLFVEALVRQGARLIAVGDRHQAIYGFRGALSNSMDLLGSKFKMEELPLSITYRCPTSVVSVAQDYCPHIEPRPNAPEGSVTYTSDLQDPKVFGDQMVICRNNAPLFKSILYYIRNRIPCQVKSNFLESFSNWIKSFKVETCPELLSKLEDWYTTECTKAREKGFLGKLAMLTDKYETLKLLASEFTQVSELLRMVKSLGDSRTGTLFTTVHKAKGLEHKNVYILRPDLIPAPFALSESQIEQEFNLLYVAITRSADCLTFGAIL